MSGVNGIPHGVPQKFFQLSTKSPALSPLAYLQIDLDNTAVNVCMKGLAGYRRVQLHTLECNELLNTSKTKMREDFGQQRAHYLPVVVKGDTMEVVRNYKYLGVNLDNNLDWSLQRDASYKKEKSKLNLLSGL